MRRFDWFKILACVGVTLFLVFVFIVAKTPVPPPPPDPRHMDDYELILPNTYPDSGGNFLPPGSH